MSTEKKGWIARYALPIFFVLAYAITWGLSILATPGILPGELPRGVRIASAILLHYGPALAGIIVAAAVAGRAGLRGLLGKILEWRVGVGWVFFVLFYPIATRLVAVGLGMLLGDHAPDFFSNSSVPGGNPILLLVPVFLGILFQAGIAEEIGWRGFALPRLQARYGALASSLILGVLWAFWHFHPQNWPALLPVAPYYIVQVLVLTVMFTWVYNNTRGSLLLAILYHTASNTSDWVVPIMPTLTDQGVTPTFIVYLVLTTLVAVLVVIVYGPQHLSRSASREQVEQ